MNERPQKMEEKRIKNIKKNEANRKQKKCSSTKKDAANRSAGDEAKQQQQQRIANSELRE